MTTRISPTPLELALLSAFYELHAAVGFPDPSSVQVISRENTGAGRYVMVNHRAGTLQDGYYDLGGRFIEMAGIPNGLMAVALVRKGKLETLEIAVYGGDGWDGQERQWAIV